MTPNRECTFVSGNEPCPTCPRLITTLHMCKMLKDELRIATEKAMIAPLSAEMAKLVARQAWPPGFTRRPKDDAHVLAVEAIATGEHVVIPALSEEESRRAFEEWVINQERHTWRGGVGYDATDLMRLTWQAALAWQRGGKS